MITEYSKAMKAIRRRVIKENVITTILKQDYDIGIDKVNGNLVIKGRRVI